MTKQITQFDVRKIERLLIGCLQSVCYYSGEAGSPEIEFVYSTPVKPKDTDLFKKLVDLEDTNKAINFLVRRVRNRPEDEYPCLITNLEVTETIGKSIIYSVHITATSLDPLVSIHED